MELFVFPVSQVLLYPSFSKPFVVEDQKYIQMFEDSLRLGIPVAVGMVFEPKKTYQFFIGQKLEFINQVAGYGLPAIIERKKNGSIVVFIEGQGKVQLGKVSHMDKPYIVCQAERIEENHEIHQEIFPLFLVLHKIMVQWLNIHISDEHSREQFLNYVMTPEKVIGCFVSYIISDIDIQQMLLDSNDINEKIELISSIIKSKGLVA